MRILFGIRSIGGANTVLPVARLAENKNDRAYIYTDSDGPASTQFSKEWPMVVSKDCTPVEVINIHLPDVVVVSTYCAFESQVNQELIDYAKKLGIKTVAVQDYWGTHCRAWWPILPDQVCVQDGFAKSLILKSWKNYPNEKVIVTGQPAFDYLANVNRQAAKQKIKSDFQLEENWPIINFSGSLVGMVDALSATIEALNQVGHPVYFFMRHHPRVFGPKATEKGQKGYESYKDIPKKLKNGIAIESSGLITSEELNAGSDITMSIYGTMLIQACCIGIPCIAVLNEEGKKDLLDSSEGLIEKFPPCQVGACLEGANTPELTKCFEKIFKGDIAGMKTAQKKHFKNDGQSAQRVYSVITNQI